ncbi:Tetratricopeptide repeat/TPR repeat [Novymonas esmeraldas]|uniref:Tetratricopeptide repeat/TPR repeat n=1 Tax=Novymonas esmeraldas TaxID=1808958 RepID=A0AAW0F1Z9_9TRYP
MPLISLSTPFLGSALVPSTASITAFKVREKHGAGLRLLQAGRVQEAIQLFHEASFFDVENVLPILALAECYVFLCDLRSAVRCYRRALWSLHKKEMDEYCRRAYEEAGDEAAPDVATDDGMSELESWHGDAASSSVASERPRSGGDTRSVASPQDSAVGEAAPPETQSEATRPPESGSSVSVRPCSPSDLSARDFPDGLQPAETVMYASAHPRHSTDAASTVAGDEQAHAVPEQLSTGEYPSSVLPPPPVVPPAALTAKDVRTRLAGVLDALGLSLYQVGSVEQALRCTTEALELLDAAARVGDGAADREREESLSMSKSPEFLADPTIALHRGVYLMALQRDEEAEALLQDHFAVFLPWRSQTAALLVQLYCNRQAFRKARVLLETQERDAEGATATATAAAHGGADSSVGLSDAAMSNGAQDSAANLSAPLSVTAAAAAAACGSLSVAKYLFTELYARYRAAALTSDDEASITRCLGIYSNDVDLLFRRAQLCLAAGQHKKSVKDLFRCVRETNGEHKEAIEAMTTVLFTIGSSLSGESEVQDAVSYYSESLKWRPDNVLVLLARGDCYTKMESFKDALADYEAVLCFAPDQRDARQRIASLHDLWGRKLFAQDQPEEAEAEFTNAIKTDSQNPDFYYHRAMCRLKLDQGRYALRDVLSCKELNPTAPHLRAFIARYLETEPPPDAEQRGNMAQSAPKRYGGRTTTTTAAATTTAAPAHAALSPSRRRGRAHRRLSPPAWRHKRRTSSDDVTSAHSDGGTVVRLPDIRRTGSLQKRGTAAELVRGCRTTLHRREPGAAASVK